jgi:hypothetical protein
MKLRLSERGTDGPGYSLWRTPKADDSNHSPASEAEILRRVEKRQTIRLQDQIYHPALLRTPDAGCARGAQSRERFKKSMAEGKLLTLNDQIAHLWPTPTAREFTGMDQPGDGRERPDKLPWAAKLFPTPRAADADKGTRTARGVLKEANRGHGMDLPSHVQLFPTPTIHGNRNPPPQRTENGRHSDQLPVPAWGNVVAGGSLNPGWVEWLMGFPIGWTADIGG